MIVAIVNISSSIVVGMRLMIEWRIGSFVSCDRPGSRRRIPFAQTQYWFVLLNEMNGGDSGETETGK